MSTSLPKPQANTTAGVVERGKIYTAEALCRELRWRKHSFRQARRLGLPLIRFGSRNYVIGDQFFEWFEQLGQQQNRTL